MNKLIIFLVVLLSVSAAVNADMNPSNQCKTYCDNTMYPVAVFTSTNDGFVKDSSVEDSVFDISVISDTFTADWTSTPMVFCVVSKEGNDYYAYPEGTEGTISSNGEPISQLTFCSEKVTVSGFGGSGSLGPTSALGAGAIWTTNGDCGDKKQDENQYNVGDVVYINGNDKFSLGTYNWDITGVSKCDKDIAVINGTYQITSDEGFCFAAYTIGQDDCGEYKASFGDKKSDNYGVNKEDTQVPEFSMLAAGIALFGASAGYLVLRKKN